jgi:prepilin-type N-terminal cleavage/methylation domain-containing protein
MSFRFGFRGIESRFRKEFRRWVRSLCDSRGFTLIEMMVGILILSILLAIAIPNLRGSGEKAQKAACESDQMLIRNALDSYWVEHHAYPSGTSSEILKQLVQEKFLQTVPQEPTGGDFTITFVNGEPVVSCSKHGELGDTTNAGSGS